jgi:hypothetical protein
MMASFQNRVPSGNFFDRRREVGRQGNRNRNALVNEQLSRGQIWMLTNASKYRFLAKHGPNSPATAGLPELRANMSRF